MSLKATSFPTRFVLQFNATSSSLLNYASQNLKITLGELDLYQANFTTAVQDSNSILIELYLSKYVAKGTLLTVTLKNAKDYNRGSLSMFSFESVTATTATKEISADSATANTASQLGMLEKQSNTGLLSLQVVHLISTFGGSTSLMRLAYFHQMFQMTSKIQTGAPSNLDTYFDSNNLLQNRRRLLQSITYSESLNDATDITFLANFEWELKIGLLLLCAGLLLFLLATICEMNSNIFGQKLQKIKKAVVFCDKMANWNLLLNFFGLIQFSGVYYSVRELFSVAKGRFVLNIPSMTCSVLFIVINLVLISLVTKRASTKYKENKYKAKKIEDSDSVSRTAFLSECKSQHTMQLLYVPLFLMRIILIAIFLATLDGHPYPATTLILAINATFFLYFAVYLPLKSNLVTYITLLIELLILIGSICNVYFAGLDASQDTLDKRVLVANICIGCSMGVTFLGYLISLVQLKSLGYSLRLLCKRRVWDRLRRPKPDRQPQKSEELKEEPSIEEVWTYWRKSVIFIDSQEWIKPSNREKLMEISNWAREMLGIRASRQVLISIPSINLDTCEGGSSTPDRMHLY